MRLFFTILLLLSPVIANAQGVEASRVRKTTFSQLSTPSDSNERYCTDCQATAPCQGGGTGAFAYRNNGVWNCNDGSGGGSGGAPTDATYITQTANGSLSAEQALSTLATGPLANTTTTGVLRAGTAVDQSIPVFCADAGSNDTYACNLSPVPTLVTGTHYRFKANTANTGAATINFNSAGAKTIKKAAGGVTTDLADNDIRAGQWVDLIYDGTNMQMQSVLGNAPSASITNSASNGQVAISDGTNLTGDTDLTFSGDTLSATKIVATTSILSSVDGTATLGDASSGRFLINAYGISVGAGAAPIGEIRNGGGSNMERMEPGAVSYGSGVTVGFSSGDPTAVARDVNISRVGVNTLGVGTGAQGSTAGSLSLTNLTTTATSSTGTAAIIDGSNVLRPLTSSLRFKENVREWHPDEHQMNAFLSLKPIEWDYKDNGAKDVVGFSAESLATVDPELVNYDNEGKPYSNREAAMVSYLFEIVKKQQAEIVKLKARMNHRKHKSTKKE